MRRMYIDQAAQDADKVAANIRAEISRRLLTQKELAERLEVATSTLNRWLTQSDTLTVQNLIAISRALGVPPVSLFYEVPALIDPEEPARLAE